MDLGSAICEYCGRLMESTYFACFERLLYCMPLWLNMVHVSVVDDFVINESFLCFSIERKFENQNNFWQFPYFSF